MAGDLNTDLGATDNDRRGSEISAAMTEAGVKDMTTHFLPVNQPWGRERRLWIMVREGRLVSSWTYYLLGTDRSLFRNVSVRDPRHNTKHYMVVGHLHSATARDHDRYTKRRRKMPLKPLTETMRRDGLFGALRMAVTKPHERDKHKNAWISEETWRLVDKRVSARRGTRVRERIWRLVRAIWESLKGDRKQRVEAAGTDVEALLGGDPPNAKEVWRRTKGWYRAAVNRAPSPALATLERITAERVELYRNVPPPGDNIPVTVTPSDIDELVPTEDEI